MAALVKRIVQIQEIVQKCKMTLTAVTKISYNIKILILTDRLMISTPEMTVMERPGINCLKLTKWCRGGSHHGGEYVDEHVDMDRYTAGNAIAVDDHN